MYCRHYSESSYILESQKYSLMILATNQSKYVE